MKLVDLKRILYWKHDWIMPSDATDTVRVKLDEKRAQHFRNLNRMIGEPDIWPGSYFDDYTTCKRIAGFSSGSRLAIGRILSCYEKQGG
jgi:hypothetical protein